jgi:hypothetical protein
MSIFFVKRASAFYFLVKGVARNYTDGINGPGMKDHSSEWFSQVARTLDEITPDFSVGNPCLPALSRCSATNE